MFVYRIAKTKHAHDLSGSGARVYGGRWNEKGIPIVYTSESRALATVEFLVHVPLSIVPRHISIVSIKIPDRVRLKEISVSGLPANWRDYPPPPELATLGTDWALANDTLLLRVPSAVVEQEFNILINPSHRQMRHVTISQIEEHKFDVRLLR
jgi:RES domain-containing protein